MVRRKNGFQAQNNSHPPEPIDSHAKETSALQSEEQASAMRLLASVIDAPHMQDLLNPEERTTAKTVYTHAVTLWMLMLQRLGYGKSLDVIISQVLTHHRDLLPDNKRVRENTLSGNSGAYSQARKRLPVEMILEFSSRVCDYLGQISERLIDGRRVFVLDGTTITLAPTPELQAAYPPASNQHGTSVWPMAQLMVANELQSGCALLPQIGAMYGPNNVSEAVQAACIVKQLPAHSIAMADEGLGIFSVAYHTIRAGHDFLFRLSHSRYKALQRRGELIEEGPTHKSHRLLWQPSARDRQSTPDLPAEVALDVVVHEVEIGSGKPLYLVSSLELGASCLSQLYRRRYEVEFDIRDVKVTLDAENIRAKSVEMFHKELYASVMAYNLVAQFRRQSAALAQIEPRRLSFKGVWTCLRHRLLLQPSCSMEAWTERYAEALYHASQKKHPRRRAPRSYPRKAHPRRAKSTKFQKAQRNQKPPDPESVPLLAIK